MNFNQVRSVKIKKDINIFKAGEEYQLNKYDEKIYYIQKDAGRMYTGGIIANLKLGKLILKVRS